MRALKTPQITPPGGWRFVDPDTGFEYNYNYRNLPHLLQHITDYRAQNKLSPIADLQAIVENWLCFQPNMDRHWRHVDRRRTVRQYFSGAKAYAKAKFSKESDYLNSQAEAEARAEICANCFFNEIPQEKSKLAELADVKIQELVGDRKSSRDRELFMCTVCSCPLRAKIHFAQWFVEQNMEDQTRYLAPSGLPGRDGKPLYCWQIHPIENKNGDPD